MKELEILNLVAEYKIKIDDLLLSDGASKLLPDGHPMLMNLMYINFWLMVERNRISAKEYPYVFRSMKKMNEAKNRMKNPLEDFYVFPKRKLSFFDKIKLFLFYNTYIKCRK